MSDNGHLPEVDLVLYQENRHKFPPEQLLPYAGKYIAWSGDGTRVGDRVGHVDELEPERPELDLLPGCEVLEVDLLEVVLIELGARHGDRQRTAVDGRHMLVPELAQEPRQRPEMILVAVSDDDRLDVGGALQQNAAWQAEIREERTNESFAWRSTKGSDCLGLATFHRLAERLTRIELELDVVPVRPAEAFELMVHIADRRAETDLRRFKARLERISPDDYPSLVEVAGDGADSDNDEGE